MNGKTDSTVEEDDSIIQKSVLLCITLSLIKFKKNLLKYTSYPKIVMNKCMYYVWYQSGLSNFTRVTSDTHISLMKTTNVYSSLRSLQLLALHSCHFHAKLSLMRLQLSGTLMDKHEGREKRSYDERDTGSYCNAWKCHMSPSLTFH